MSLNALKVLKGISKVPSVFLSGVAFGTLGLKLLTSKEAKKGYATVLAKTYKAKDGIDNMVSAVKQHADDIVADAKDLYQAEKTADQLASLEGELRAISSVASVKWPGSTSRHFSFYLRCKILS